MECFELAVPAIFVSYAHTFFFRFRKKIRRAVKKEHVKKTEHDYVTVRSQVRSEAMYTIPESNEGESYQEPNETYMIDWLVR